MKRPLPARANAVLKVTETFIDERGYAPSLREIADRVGLASPSTVWSHLLRLKRRGLVTWDEGRPRTLRVLSQEVS